MFSKKDIVILRILPDPEFIASAIAAVTTFFKLAVLPELVGKYFSNTFKEPIASSATAANVYSTNTVKYAIRPDHRCLLQPDAAIRNSNVCQFTVHSQDLPPLLLVHEECAKAQVALSDLSQS